MTDTLQSYTECYRVLDNGGETFDRYTLCFEHVSFPSGDPDDPDITWSIYGASENPYHPQGFGQYCGDYSFSEGEDFPEIGEDVAIESLPEGVKRMIRSIESES